MNLFVTHFFSDWQTGIVSESLRVRQAYSPIPTRDVLCRVLPFTLTLGVKAANLSDGGQKVDKV